jgi:predicted DNA-binding protein (MmcQ/YjbR family)
MNTETLRTICLQLLAATEDMKWEKDLVFSIGGKMFCVTSFEEPFQASFKVPDEHFEELCNREGFVPAPYMARAKWVLVSKTANLSKQEWVTFVEQSYKLVKSKLTQKQRIELGIAG